MVPDPKEIEVANLPPKEEVASAPPANPKEAGHKLLQDKLAEMLGDGSHPLDVPEDQTLPGKETAQETPEPAAVSAPATPTVQPHPQSLIDAARKLGIDERHLTPGANSTDALFDWVMSQRQAAPATLPATKEPVVEPPDKYAAFIDQQEKDGFLSPEMAGLLREQRAELKELRKLKELGDPEQVVSKVLSKREAEREAVQQKSLANERAIDGGFAALPPKFEKVFGKGPLDKLESADHKAQRLTIFNAAGLNLEKDTADVIAQKIAAVAKRTFDSLIPEPEPEKKKLAAGAYGNANGKAPVLMTKEEWDRASLGRPNGKAPSKQEAAKRQVLHDAFREMGIEVGDRPDELEGVPG